MEKTKVSVKEETKKENVQGKLTYEDKVIQKIIGISLEKVEGLLTVDGGFFSNLAGKLVNTDDVTSGVVVEVGEKQVAVDLDIVAEYGKDIYKIYNEMKEIITKEVKNMTGLEVIEVNVKMYKKKIKVRITGNTSDNLDIINQTNQLVKNIELYLKTFIGLDTSIKAEVVFKNISRSGKSKQKQKRVI